VGGGWTSKTVGRGNVAAGFEFRQESSQIKFRRSKGGGTPAYGGRGGFARTNLASISGRGPELFVGLESDPERALRARSTACLSAIHGLGFAWEPAGTGKGPRSGKTSRVAAGAPMPRGRIAGVFVFPGRKRGLGFPPGGTVGSRENIRLRAKWIVFQGRGARGPSGEKGVRQAKASLGAKPFPGFMDFCRTYYPGSAFSRAAACGPGAPRASPRCLGRPWKNRAILAHGTSRSARPSDEQTPQCCLGRGIFSRCLPVRPHRPRDHRVSVPTPQVPPSAKAVFSPNRRGGGFSFGPRPGAPTIPRRMNRGSDEAASAQAPNSITLGKGFPPAFPQTRPLFASLPTMEIRKIRSFGIGAASAGRVCGRPLSGR